MAVLIDFERDMCGPHMSHGVFDIYAAVTLTDGYENRFTYLLDLLKYVALHHDTAEATIACLVRHGQNIG